MTSNIYDRIETDWSAYPKRMLTWEQQAKKLENEPLIKAVKLLLPIARNDAKTIFEDSGYSKNHDALLEVMWWLMDKHEQFLVESGETIE